VKYLPVLIAALLLASCGSTASSSSSASQSAAQPTSSAKTSAAPPSATAAATTSRTGSAPTHPARCRSRSLALSFLGQQGATGHGELGFALRNVGRATCRTYGYPGIVFLGRAGQALPTAASRTTHDFFGVAPLVALVVAPGSSVSFRIGVTHGITSPARCTTAYGLQVIAPDDTAATHTTIPDGAYECVTATVSPLRPGTSAYP
jgi:hypothetical protein